MVVVYTPRLCAGRLQWDEAGRTYHWRTQCQNCERRVRRGDSISDLIPTPEFTNLCPMRIPPKGSPYS